MEVRTSEQINNKGLFTTKQYKKGEVVFTLVGQIYDNPTRETIHIGNNKHIYDEFGKFINHSFTPNIYIDNLSVIAIVNIDIDEELVFNYNESEINMASPFYAENILVCGKQTIFNELEITEI